MRGNHFLAPAWSILEHDLQTELHDARGSRTYDRTAGKHVRIRAAATEPNCLSKFQSDPLPGARFSEGFLLLIQRCGGATYETCSANLGEEAT